jgi:hypothetical protein
MNAQPCTWVDPSMKDDEAASELEALEAELHAIEIACARLRKHIEAEIEKGLRFKSQRDLLLDWIGERFGRAALSSARDVVRGELKGQESGTHDAWIGSPRLPVNAPQHCPNCGSPNIACTEIIAIDSDCYRCKDCGCTWDDNADCQDH